MSDRTIGAAWAMDRVESEIGSAAPVGEADGELKLGKRLYGRLGVRRVVFFPKCSRALSGLASQDLGRECEALARNKCERQGVGSTLPGGSHG